VDKLVPKAIIKNKYSAPWIDGDVIHLSNKKNSARLKAKLTNKPTDWNKYKFLNNKLKNLVHKKHKNFLNSCFKDIDYTPKKFWGLVSQKNKKGSLPSEMYLNDQVSSDSSNKANLFNNYFSSQFNTSTYPEPNIPTFINENLSNLILSEVEVYNVLTKLDINKANGPDGIATIIYKNCAKTLCESLTLLFNLSLSKGIIPQEWKKANIVPVFKKGNKSDISNYRPISLLPIVGKVLERCVHSHIYGITKLDINDKQHGFMEHKSTSTQLVEFYEKIFNSVEKKT
jgi:hypothetical protein